MNLPKLPPIQMNLWDKLLNYFDPREGTQRQIHRQLQAHRKEMAMTGGYTGARRDRRATSEWKTSHADADYDILPDLPILRERCRDLSRNNPLARGALNTKVTNVVGTGLKLQARIDYEYLGLSADEAEAWERNVEREFRLWADSPNCDRESTLNFYGLQAMAFRQTLENGDSFVLLPYWPRKSFPYGTCIQLVEADRVSNPSFAIDKPTLAGGVEKDDAGAPIAYHILKTHPGNPFGQAREWVRYPAFSETGRRLVLHLLTKERPGQSRGVPDLAPVIELFKQLGNYTDAEVMAAVVSAMFTLFVESQFPQGFTLQDMMDAGVQFSDKDLKLGNGLIAYLRPGEKVSAPVPGRPNQAFDPFVIAILRQIGVALELPFEVLIKHFTASYSASRAALLEAWKFFMSRRAWLADNFCQPVYEAWLEEAVASGRIAAPGFLSGDYAIRKAYARADWIGPARGQIDELKEVNAAIERINAGISTLEQETEQLNGGNWLDNQRQRAKEAKLRKELELENPVVPPKGLVMPGDEGKTDE